MTTCLDCTKNKRCMESGRLYPCRDFKESSKMTPCKAMTGRTNKNPVLRERSNGN